MNMRKPIAGLVAGALLFGWLGLCAVPEASCGGKACCPFLEQEAQAPAPLRSCASPCTLTQKIAYAVLGLGADPARLFVQAVAVPLGMVVSRPELFRALSVFLEPTFPFLLASSPPSERGPPA